MVKHSVSLIYPPLVGTSYLHIYPSLPVLAASLKQHGFGAKQLDLNNAFIKWYLKSDTLRREISRAKKHHYALEKKSSLNEFEYEEYVRFENLNELLILIKKSFPFYYSFAYSLFLLLGLVAPEPVLNADITNILRRHNKTLNLIRKFYKEYFAPVRKENPLFVGISIAMATQVIPSLLLTRLLKRHLWKGVKVFWGGPLMSLLDDNTHKVIFKYGMVDGIVISEGEEAITEIAAIMKNNSNEKPTSLKTVPNLVCMKKSRIVRSKIRPRKHISEYPPPLYDRQVLKKYGYNSMIGVLLSRGCSWGRCAFCEYPRHYNRKQLVKPEKVVDNIHYLISKHPDNPLLLSCDMMEPAYVRELCKAIIKRGIKFRWLSFMRADDRYSLADLKLIKRSGCCFAEVGIESLDTKVLNRINKGYTADQAVSFLRKLLRSGIQIAFINMIVNLPGTTYRSALRQHKVLKEIIEDAAKSGFQYAVSPEALSVLKNAPMGICPEKYGIELAIPGNRKISHYVSCLPYLDKKGMTKDEVNRLFGLYRELNASLKVSASNTLRSYEGLYPSDKLHYQKDSVLVQDHLFEPDGEDRIHRRAPSALVRITNIESCAYLTMSNADLARWILKRLPTRFSELKRVFRKEAPSQMDEHDLIDTLHNMISVGVLRVSRSNGE